MDSIPPKCQTPSLCIQTECPTSWCHDCQTRFEDLAIQSALDMGVPDYFFCPDCELAYTTGQKFIEHLPCQGTKC